MSLASVGQPVSTHPALTVSAQNPHSAKRIEFIDILRCFACLWVLLHHSLTNHVVSSGPAGLFSILGTLAQIGWLGVSLFLVLSGFCLYYPFVRKNNVRDIRIDVKDFAIKRFRRIAPPYYASLAICSIWQIAVSVSEHKPASAAFVGWYDIPLHLLFLHNLTHETYASINGVFWSLSLEAELYVIFPVVVWIAAVRGLSSALLVTFAVSVAWQAGVFMHFGFLNPKSIYVLYAPWYQALPGRCFEFVLGMAAAELVCRPKPGQHKAAFLLLILLIVPGVYYAAFVSEFGPLIDQMWGIIFASIIVLLSAVDNSLFKSNKLLQMFSWIGTISYSIYLIHIPVFFLIADHLRFGNSGPATVFKGLIWIVSSILSGYLFHICFERPFINLKSQKQKANT